MAEETVDTQAIIDVAQAGTAPHALDPEKHVGVVVPARAHFHEVDLERHLPRPRRASGEARVDAVEDLVLYVERHHEPGNLTIWLDGGNPVTAAGASVTAILNDHTGEKPGWGDHRVVLPLEPTVEWKRWMNRNGVLGDQSDFAALIEESVLNIVEPDAAQLLEIVQSIEGTSMASFRSARRLDNGAVGFKFEENIEASAGESGELEIPREFRLRLSPFPGETRVDMVARLRYRVRGGDLVIGYSIERPEDVLLEAVDQIAGQLNQTFPNVVFKGSPRA